MWHDVGIFVWIVVTVACYAISLAVQKRWQTPLTSPVFVSTALLVGLLFASHTSYPSYLPARDVLTELFGAATVALAVPLYKQRQTVAAYARPILVGLVAGSVVTMVTAVVLAKLLRLPIDVATSLSLKSVTTPIAMQVAQELPYANAALAAAAVFLTARIGEMFGLPFLTLVGIRHPVARALAMGVVSTVGGTARVAREGELQGAVAGVAMGLCTILVSLVAPSVVPVVARSDVTVSTIVATIADANVLRSGRPVWSR